MLLNLSNHPSSNWSESQLNTAIQTYGSVEDLPFPNIPPEWDRDRVLQLADDYTARIALSKASAVHIMGELVFTHLLVTRLEEIGIPCIASTTERIVEMEGDVKKIRFGFIQFRSY